MKSTLAVPLSLAGSVAALFFFQVDFVSSQLSFGGGGTQFRASDPGVRGGAAGAGGQLEGLSGTQAAFFTAGTVGRDGFRNDHQDGAAVALPVDRAPALIQSRSVFISEAVRAALPGGICSSPSRLTAL